MSKKELLELFQQHWGRLLSPFEFEEVSKLIEVDGWSPGMVAEALRVAVLKGVYNLAYILGILRSWRARRITTVEQARTERFDFNGRADRKAERKSNVPEWSNPNYVNTTTPEEQEELERFKEELLKKLEGMKPNA